MLLFQLADSADGPNTGMDYHIEMINKDDKLRVLKFLRRFFFRDEPLNQSIQLIPEGEDSTCEELEDYCSQGTFENNLSLMAVSTNGTIVGVSLNGKSCFVLVCISFDGFEGSLATRRSRYLRIKISRTRLCNVHVDVDGRWMCARFARSEWKNCRLT